MSIPAVRNCRDVQQVTSVFSPRRVIDQVPQKSSVVRSVSGGGCVAAEFVALRQSAFVPAYRPSLKDVLFPAFQASRRSARDQKSKRLAERIVSTAPRIQAEVRI